MGPQQRRSRTGSQLYDVGAAIGALCAAFMTARIGRKRSLLTGAALFIVGSVGSGLAVNVDMLIGFRLILGLSVGIASYTAPLYLAEMADKDSRGQVISGYQLWLLSGFYRPSCLIRISVTVVLGG